jgi:CheY-like chemotaxis protein
MLKLAPQTTRSEWEAEFGRRGIASRKCRRKGAVAYTTACEFFLWSALNSDGIGAGATLVGVMKAGEALEAREVTAVLVVDDDEAVLKVTKKALVRRGYRVVACGSGDEALRWLGRETFDCMVTDVQMPGINGLRLLRAVRDRDLDLPVVLMTGNPDVATAAAAVEYGASQYLIKPVGIDRLDETVKRAANTGRMARLKREYVEQYGSGTFPTGDRAGMDALLDRALASLWMAYQPIVRASNGSGARGG